MEELEVDVYGLSLDDVHDLAAFVEAQELNFKLLSDPDGSAARKYGVYMERRNFANRVTFVLDDKGVVKHVDQSVDVRGHGEDLVVKIAELKGR